MHYIRNGAAFCLVVFVLAPALLSAEVKTDSWPNGKVKWERNYTDGELDGVSKQYDEAGTLQVEEHYKNGKRNGIHRSYYSDGTLRVEGNYKDGLKDGEETTHLRWENKKTVNTYQNGKAIHARRYDEKGRLRDEMLFEYAAEGSWKIRQRLYDEKGKMILDQTL